MHHGGGGDPQGKTVAHGAAQQGHLPILRWLHENNIVPLDAEDKQVWLISRFQKKRSILTNLTLILLFVLCAVHVSFEGLYTSEPSSIPR